VDTLGRKMKVLLEEAVQEAAIGRRFITKISSKGDARFAGNNRW
jgi:hypothetical protein